MNSFILDAAIKQAKELIEHDSQVTALIANARAFAGDWFFLFCHLRKRSFNIRIFINAFYASLEPDAGFVAE